MQRQPLIHLVGMLKAVENRETKAILENIIPEVVNCPFLVYISQSTLKKFSVENNQFNIDWSYALKKIDDELRRKAVSILLHR